MDREEAIIAEYGKIMLTIIQQKRLIAELEQRAQHIERIYSYQGEDDNDDEDDAQRRRGPGRPKLKPPPTPSSL